MSSINHEARMISKRYRQPLLMTLLYLGLYIAFRDLLIQVLPIFSLCIVVITIAIHHAEVKVGLDVVEENNFIPQQTAMVGITRIKDLFSTYLWSEIIIYIVLIMILVLIIFAMFPYFMGLYQAIESQLAYGIDVGIVQLFNIVAMISNVGLVLSEIIYNTFFFTIPYLHETKQIKGLKAIKEAFKLQKGHFIEIVKTFMPYYALMLIFGCITILVNYYITHSILYSLIDICVSLASILIYESEYVVCKALLYKKLSLED